MSRNPDLSEDDAAMLVAAHIKSKQPKNYGYYRVGAIRDLGGSHKLRPKMDPKLRVVSGLSRRTGPSSMVQRTRLKLTSFPESLLFPPPGNGKRRDPGNEWL